VDAITEMLSAALEVHLALITVGQNEVVKRLASWAAILAVPTMIASFYGMNFRCDAGVALALWVSDDFGRDDIALCVVVSTAASCWVAVGIGYSY
jgi:hypothetical protein